LELVQVLIRRKFKNDEKPVSTSQIEDLMKSSRQVGRVWKRLERDLSSAANGIASSISPEKRKLKVSEDKSGTKRTASKLQTLN
jgi:hypothetical protein